MIRKHRCRTELPYNDLRARFLVDEKWGYLLLATWGHRNCLKRPNSSLYNGQTRDEGVNRSLDR